MELILLDLILTAPKVQSTLRVTLLVPGMHNQKTNTLKKILCMNYDTLRFLPYDHLVFLVLNLLARQKNSCQERI